MRTAAGLSRSSPEDGRHWGGGWGEWGLNPQLRRKGWRKPTALRGCDHEAASLVPETVEARAAGRVVQGVGRGRRTLCCHEAGLLPTRED